MLSPPRGHLARSGDIFFDGHTGERGGLLVSGGPEIHRYVLTED